MRAGRGMGSLRKSRLCGLTAQSVLEYAVLIACVAAALIAMQIYMKRGNQGRLRQASDAIGEQYAPLSVNSNVLNRVDSTIIINQTLVPLGNMTDEYGLPIYGINSTTNYNETSTRRGTERMGQFEGDLF